MPDALIKFGLIDAIVDYCNTATAANLNIKFQKLGEERLFQNNTNLNIYRIVQELINNAINHGKASDILIQFAYESTKLFIDVDDNGVGFVQNNAQASGMGLHNLRQRVNYLNVK